MPQSDVIEMRFKRVLSRGDLAKYVATPIREKRSRSSGAYGGFMILELLVGIVILTILVILLAQILSFTSRAWMGNVAGIERLQNIRSVSDFMGSELEAALLPANRVATNDLQFVVNPGGLSAKNLNRDSIFWQMPLSPESDLGDVAEVGYFVRWDTTNNAANPRPNLYRFFLSPADTSNGVAAGSDSSFIYQKPDEWVSDSLLTRISPGDKTNQYKGLFAENVVGIWVRCLDSLGEQITTDFKGSSLSVDSTRFRFDSRLGFTDSQGRKSEGEMTPTGAVPLAALPIAVEFGISTLDSHSAARITPGIQSKLISLAAQSTSAKDFVSQCQADSFLHPIVGGLRYFETRIQLVNSR